MRSFSHTSRFGLLYVIVAAGIVVLLFPLFVPGRPHDHSRTQGISNMKMLLTAGLIYASDFDEFLPPHGHFEAEGPASGSWIKGDQMAWRSSLMPYLKNQSLFSAPGWPFRDREGSRLELVRGVTNGASCFGYVEEIKPKWFGSESGTLRLNPADPPEGFLQELGIEQAEAPLLEDLAWTEKGWFGRIHTHRVADKLGRGKRVLGYMDMHAKLVPAED